MFFKEFREGLAQKAAQKASEKVALEAQRQLLEAQRLEHEALIAEQEAQRLEQEALIAEQEALIEEERLNVIAFENAKRYAAGDYTDEEEIERYYRFLSQYWNIYYDPTDDIEIAVIKKRNKFLSHPLHQAEINYHFNSPTVEEMVYEGDEDDILNQPIRLSRLTFHGKDDRNIATVGDFRFEIMRLEQKNDELEYRNIELERCISDLRDDNERSDRYARNLRRECQEKIDQATDMLSRANEVLEKHRSSSGIGSFALGTALGAAFHQNNKK